MHCWKNFWFSICIKTNDRHSIVRCSVWHLARWYLYFLDFITEYFWWRFLSSLITVIGILITYHQSHARVTRLQVLGLCYYQWQVWCFVREKLSNITRVFVFILSIKYSQYMRVHIFMYEWGFSFLNIHLTKYTFNIGLFLKISSIYFTTSVEHFSDIDKLDSPFVRFVLILIHMLIYDIAIACSFKFLSWYLTYWRQKHQCSSKPHGQSQNL